MGMVDVSKKESTSRVCMAEGLIHLSAKSIIAIREKRVKKGDALTVAEAAALLAIKRTSEIIPHCHPIPITFAGIEFEFAEDAMKCTCTVKTLAQTGVEMEALVGVTTALLTLWDMVKYLEKDETGNYPTTRISNIRVVSKQKGE